MSYISLIKLIKSLQNSNIKTTINSKITKFKKFQNSSSEEIFKELCFCLMTANFNAQRALDIQINLNNKLITLPLEELRKELKKLGHRFPNKRAEYIFENRKHIETIKNILKNYNNDFERREWLVKNIKGLGMKESSHFLRNIGFLNVAILDFHIIDILFKEQIVFEKPTTITKNKYIEIEKELELLCKKLNISQGELDFYLWYTETGKIIK